MYSNLAEIDEDHFIDLVVIDDDPFVIKWVNRISNRCELSSFCFTNPQSALLFLADHRSRVLIIDYNIPAMNGLEILHTIQNTSVRSMGRTYLCSSVNLPDDVKTDALRLGARTILKDKLIERDFLIKACSDDTSV